MGLMLKKIKGTERQLSHLTLFLSYPRANRFCFSFLSLLASTIALLFTNKLSTKL